MNTFAAFDLYSTPMGKRKLASNFRPGPYDVICARGKMAHAHQGNQRFRELVRVHRDAYSQASTKYQKSQIVSHITNVVRQSSPEGGFVKLIDGCWHEVGDRACKEKIGQTMRDLLHTKYSSSTKAKAKVRVQKRIEEYRAEAALEAQRYAPYRTDHAGENKSFVSVVSHGSDDYPSQVPSQVEILPTSEELYLDAYAQFEQENAPGFEPLPMSMPQLQQSVPVEFHDSDLGSDTLSDDEILELCNVMCV